MLSAPSSTLAVQLSASDAVHVVLGQAPREKGKERERERERKGEIKVAVFLLADVWRE